MKKEIDKLYSWQVDFSFLAKELMMGYFIPISNGGQFSELGALINLLEMCTHASHEVLNGKSPGHFKQGSTRTSLADMAEQWGWSRNRVNKFLKKLTKTGIIHLEPSTDGTVISLVEFGD